MSQLEIDVEILDPRYKTGEFEMPRYKTEGSAGMDLIAAIDEPITLKGNEVKLIPTGLKLHIGNPGFVGMLFPRSGLGHKKGLVLGNLTGIIDSDYQGQLMVSLWNRKPNKQQDSFTSATEVMDDWITINPGDSIAQYVVVPVIQASLNVVDSLESVGQRGEGGFGSTDLFKVVCAVQMSADSTRLSLSDGNDYKVPLDFSWREGDRVEHTGFGKFKRVHPSTLPIPTIQQEYTVAVIKHQGSNEGLSTVALSPTGTCQVYAPNLRLGDTIYQTTDRTCLTLDQVMAMAKAGSLNIAGTLDIPKLFDR